MRTLFLCLVLAGMTTLPAVAPAQNLPTLGDTERQELSPLMERKLGEQIMRDIRRDRDYLDDAPLLEYLNAVGNKLLTARPEARGEAGYDFFFFAVRDPMLNAFALPGGFIALHTGTLLAAQTESEMAAVLAHEIGHVSQRHIARMLGRQKQDALIPLATTILGILAARSNPDAAQALIMGGEGFAAQRYLSFSRDAEREADRVGLQIMRDAGMDASGMVAFFGRMQTASRAYDDSFPFLRSHPLTTERIADIQSRLQEQRYRQHTDSLDFHLMRARARLLQDDTPLALANAATVFESQLQQKNRAVVAAGKYGLAMIALKQHQFDKALSLLQEARSAADGAPEAARTSTYGGVLASLGIEIRLAARQFDEAVREADAARARYPLARGIARQYAEALIDAGRTDDAIAFLRDQAQLYRQEPRLHELLARSYAAKGRQALQHMALAESYALSGSLQAALDQLNIARGASDASFYDLAVIDARERDLRARVRDEMKDGQKGK